MSARGLTCLKYMPSVSEKQREMMAIAEHHPNQLYEKNRGVLKMSHEQLHDFAATKGLHKKAATRIMESRRKKK